ncbi:MAG: ABC transporter substrate-binding protein [Acidobacteriaceae bacterium]
MFERLHLNNLLAVILLVGLVSCNYTPSQSTLSIPHPSATAAEIPPGKTPWPTGAATPLPAPARLLTICLGYEPASLFYYDATSLAARDVLAAVYDGPVDVRNYIAFPVVLEKLPSLADGDAVLKPVEVKPGDLIVDSAGEVVNLDAGVSYRPSGCSQSGCAQIYPGEGTVDMDQLVLSFELKPDVLWSDGEPLTSSDSVYSYALASSLLPPAQAAVISRTASYKATGETSVEWVGVPGYQDGFYQAKFFSPLPQHAWSSSTAEELRSSRFSARTPLGWGPYIIDDWISGDHITLRKNPLYFRAGEGLPHYDNLVFRFVSGADEALDALQAGECDLIDRTAALDPQSSRLADLQQAGKLQVVYQYDTAWEQLAFGIIPFDSQREQIFALKEVRQAIAMCIDREALVAGQASSARLLMDSFVPASHPLYNPGVRHYDFDPLKASTLLESAGWQDPDDDPATPRIAQGVNGVQDGTPFEVEYLVAADAKPQADAVAIQEMLEQCGIRTKIIPQQPGDYLAPGPEGPVFGRSFELAQFAWATDLEPPCYLFMSREIPGPYPEFPQGWGGANATGFTNPQYDQACQDALFSLPDSAQHQGANFQAQEIFSQELPVLPLYSHYSVIVSRLDICGLQTASAVDSALWNLEELDDGNGC